MAIFHFIAVGRRGLALAEGMRDWSKNVGNPKEARELKKVRFGVWHVVLLSQDSQPRSRFWYILGTLCACNLLVQH